MSSSPSSPHRRSPSSTHSAAGGGGSPSSSLPAVRITIRPPTPTPQPSSSSSFSPSYRITILPTSPSSSHTSGKVWSRFLNDQPEPRNGLQELLKDRIGGVRSRKGVALLLLAFVMWVMWIYSNGQEEGYEGMAGSER
ncbi:hypothetical protein BCR35DRAFT_309687 [Leucosporidium creatinivorum]|uniref:Uncharacterized protein n=1 Tax=Leucosporidium creatinivorum TaxID=106004 RepID=A0A1Y2DCV6_9BASI|nr:hypothetical protein BCR35DRAFT_309687 [Leucosporidium creatinivorum]